MSRWLRGMASRLVERLAAGHLARREAEVKARLIARFLARTEDLDLAQQLLQTNRLRRAAPPAIWPAPAGRRLLILAPHHDDEVIGCGGLALQALAAGSRVQVLYLTDGARPSLKGPEREAYIRTREQEAEAVCQAMGAEPPLFWRLPCQEFPLDPPTVRRLVAAVTEFASDCVFVPFFLEDVADHRKAAHLLWLAGGELTGRGLEVWSYKVTSLICPNVAVDCTRVEQRKLELMGLYRSQERPYSYRHLTMGQDIANSLYVRGTLPDRPEPFVELFLVLPLEQFYQTAAPYFGQLGREGQGQGARQGEK